MTLLQSSVSPMLATNGEFPMVTTHFDFDSVTRYTFAQTLIVLSPNEFSPTEQWSNGDQTDILIGIENYDEFTQANIDAGIVAYSVGIIYGMNGREMRECVTKQCIFRSVRR